MERFLSIIKTVIVVGIFFVVFGFAHTSYAALAQTELTTSGALAAGPFTTASISPSSNNLVLAFIELHTGGTLAATVTLSGNSLTWVQIATSSGINAAPALPSASKIFVFRAMGASPTSGAVTITNSGTVTGASWSIVQWSGVTTAGTNGSGAVVQVVTATGTTGTSHSLSMAAFGSASNGVSTMWVVRSPAGVTDTITPSNGHTGNTQYTVISPAGQNIGTRSQYLITSDTAPAASIPNNSTGWGGAAVEVTAIGAGGPTPRPTSLFVIQGSQFRVWGGLFRVR